MADAIVKVEHILAAGFCCHGARYFCQLHGFDWSHFVINGVPVSSIAHIDDEQMRSVIAVAVKEAERGFKE